ncbi:unnamed protein product [Rhodiola kirilowii]
MNCYGDCLLHTVLFVAALICLVQTSVHATQKSYIVYMGSHSHGLRPTAEDTEIATQSHYDLLESVLGISTEKAKEATLYSYNKYINGFAAVLSEEEVERIKNAPGVVSVFENKLVKLQTTRSWEFLGLEKKNGVPTKHSLWKKSKYGNDIIIATLDTGVWPESESFNDKGLGPIPSRWKGACVDGSPNKVKCNKKLICARYFYLGYAKETGLKLNSSYHSARDTAGHGTHTLSTAGGSFVAGANIVGNYDYGTAKGGAPHARVAAYKVCWEPFNDIECITADILAAFEVAIDDGVDVLSVSLGAGAEDYITDGLAIGAFHAVQHGIPVVAAAGNYGPIPSTVCNTAPWIFTVGASTLDRDFANSVSFGGKDYKGKNLGGERLPNGQFYPVINSTSAKLDSATVESATLCLPDSLDSSKVKGKIVVCLRGINPRIEKSLVVLKAGGAGYILANDFENKDSPLSDDLNFLPASEISYEDSQALFKFINTTNNPQAFITETKTFFDSSSKRAPVIADFSSIGPNSIDPEIIKPDIIAPGVSIIAAYSETASPTTYANDTRRVKFDFLSGTSMSTPHITGIVALLKNLHPDWSSAAIRSAIMTTASTTDNTKKPISDSSGNTATPLHYGSGHVNPNKAANPGLVYDLSVNDYLNFLCAKNYTEKNLKDIAQKPYKCPESASLLNLNYPSIAVPKLSGSIKVTREVKNVGKPGNYTAMVTAPDGVSVTVEPVSLKFDKAGEVKKFSVSLKAEGKLSPENYVFGSLVWSDGKHIVRSPIAVAGA